MTCKFQRKTINALGPSTHAYRVRCGQEIPERRAFSARNIYIYKVPVNWHALSPSFAATYEADKIRAATSWLRQQTTKQQQQQHRPAALRHCRMSLRNGISARHESFPLLARSAFIREMKRPVAGTLARISPNTAAYRSNARVSEYENNGRSCYSIHFNKTRATVPIPLDVSPVDSN